MVYVKNIETKYYHSFNICIIMSSYRPRCPQPTLPGVNPTLLLTSFGKVISKIIAVTSPGEEGRYYANMQHIT